MAAGERRPGPPEWTGAVRVREDAALSRELAERLERSGHLRSVSVSDLVSPRRALWRRLAPLPPLTPERRESLTSGRAWHRAAGRLFASEGALEVRVRTGGISCRIDLLADVPVEIKTGSGPLPIDPVDQRPDHLEQLAMYCGLLDRPVGRLVHIETAEGRPSDVGATDVRFADLDTIRAEMRSRATVLRDAIEQRRAVGLPRCRWFGRGCEFQQTGVCDCRGDEPEPSSAIRRQVTGTDVRADIATRWLRSLSAVVAISGPKGAERFRDLLYPRRAYYERTRGAAPGVAVPTATARVPGLYDRLLEATESGPVGEVVQLLAAPTAPDEEVVGFRGAPLLVRTSRAWSRIDPARATERFPQYALELAFRCVATETAFGRTVVGYENAETDRDRVQVLEYRFDPISRFAALAEDRARRFATALAGGPPHELELCAAWMVADCPYRAECACPVDAPRSQR